MKTQITYLQPVMQIQGRQNAQNIKGKSYEKFFNPQLAAPVEMVNAVNAGALPSEKIFAPTAENLNRWLADPYQMPVSGYGVLNEGGRGITAFTCSRHFMPNVNSEMFKWWMLWHTVEKERYTLWFPQAHISNSLADPERAADTSLSFEERFYNNSNHIVEYIGEMVLDTEAEFVPPTQFGFTQELLEKQGITASASGWAHTVGNKNVATAILIHLVRNVDGGAEMFSLYYTTPHAEFSRIAQIEGAGERGVQFALSQGLTERHALSSAYEMAVHDMTEFTHLAEILPELYAQFGQQ